MKMSGSSIESSSIDFGNKDEGVTLSESEIKELIKSGVDDRIADEVKKFERQLKTDKATIITILSLFAAVMMFFLGDIQIFKTIIGYWRVIGFSLIFLSSLLFFVIVIDYVGHGWINANEEKPYTFRKGMLWTIVIVFVAGIICSIEGQPDASVSSAQNNNAIGSHVRFITHETVTYQKQS